MQKLLTPREAADILGVSVSLLAQWRYLGEGPTYKRIGPKVIKYQLSDLEEFVEAKTRRATKVAV